MTTIWATLSSSSSDIMEHLLQPSLKGQQQQERISNKKGTKHRCHGTGISGMLTTTLLVIAFCVASTAAFVPLKKPPQSIATRLGAKKRPETNKPPRFTQAVHRSDSKRIQKDRMWNTRKKSIEELEAIMEQRWGTDMSTFTANDDYNNDDEDEDEHMNENEPMRPQNKDRVFRARRVKDPWGEEDDNEDSNRAEEHGGNVSLQRVKRNQERAQKKLKQPLVGADDKASNANYPEFYDPEDEGYSSRGGSLGHMIQPKPVGGVGSRATANRGASGPGFFFRPPAEAAATSSEQGDPQQKKKGVAFDSIPNAEEASTESLKRKRAPKPLPSKPLLDKEDGSPMFLTLEQAERNFRKSLTDSDKNSLSLSENSNERSDGDEADDYDKFSRTDNLLASGQSWQELGIDHPVLLENLQDMGCTSPLSVQTKTCPSVLSGHDVVVGTYTGSGKTLAFLVPLAQRLLQDSDGYNTAKGSSVKLLIVAPGRELASQIVAVARELLQDTGLSVFMAIGGTTFARNLEQLRKRKPDIVVGTPGRMAELVVGRPGETKSGRLKTSSLQAVVLDEFDALFEYKPHREPTMALMENLQRQQSHGYRQFILCSATASDILDSPKVQNFLRPGFSLAMADEKDVIVTSAAASHLSSKTAPPPRVSKTVIHGVVHVPHQRLALDTLRRILHTEPFPQQILIFVENSRKVDMIVERLEKVGILAASLHGGSKSEKMDRAQVNKALREGYVGIVVATELAARGLDAPLLTHVINMDLPTDASHYAHRAGRCGRGGRPGVVLNLTTNPKERKVPHKLASQLGVDMFNVEVRNGKLNLVDALDA